ncbi:MAG: PP2C family protein-serine/threonine phosphatase [Acidobacteriota bacterium]
MREKLYLTGFLGGAGFLLFLGRDFIQSSVLVTWGLAFGGTTGVAVLLVALYRLQLQLQASRLELARKEAEISFAREVQQALFPRQFPKAKGLEFSAICIPASGISGDYYDVLCLPDGRIVFAIADISGKGISAAMLMANLQALLRAMAHIHASPCEVMGRLNHHLHQVTDSSRFATFFYAQWNLVNRKLHYINAGHNPPILLNGEQAVRLETGGVPLGIFPAAEFQMESVVMEPEDLLILFSDGITEAVRADEEFGDERLLQAVKRNRHLSLEGLQNRILEEVRRWSGREADDDMTLVMVRATHEDGLPRGRDEEAI